MRAMLCSGALVLALGACADLPTHESLKGDIVATAPAPAPVAPIARPHVIREPVIKLTAGDTAYIKAARDHALRNGLAHWANPETGNHGSIKTGRAERIDRSLCTEITETVYSHGTGLVRTTRLCDPPVAIKS